MRHGVDFPEWYWDDSTTDEERKEWMRQELQRRRSMRQ